MNYHYLLLAGNGFSSGNRVPVRTRTVQEEAAIVSLLCVVRLFVVRRDEAYVLHVPIRCGNSDTWVAFACCDYGRGYFLFRLHTGRAQVGSRSAPRIPHSHGCAFGQGANNGPKTTT